jgi:hypothetical protein
MGCLQTYCLCYDAGIWIPASTVGPARGRSFSSDGVRPRSENMIALDLHPTFMLSSNPVNPGLLKPTDDERLHGFVYIRPLKHLVVDCSGCRKLHYYGPVKIDESTQAATPTPEQVQAAILEVSALGWVRGPVPSLPIVCKECRAKLGMPIPVD